MHVKKWMTGAIAAAMLFTVIGCSGGNGTNESATPGNNSETKSNGAEKPASLEKVTFSYFNAAAAAKDINTNETTIGKMLEDQTGVNFKIEHLVGDLNTKIGTMIASNDYPDVLIPDAAIDKVLDAGAFIPLNDLIEEHGPNIKKVYGPYFDQMKAADGNIYFIPFSNVVGEYVPDPSIGQGAFWVQRRVLEEAGYPKINKLDDYFKLIEDYMNKHKDEDLTGFMTLTHDWRFFATSNPPMHLEGYPNDGGVIVDMNTFEAKTYAAADSTKRWLQKLNDINAKGMFDKASFVDNYDQYLAKMTSGKVLGFFDYGWQVGNATNNLSDAAKADPSKDGLRYFPLPVTFDGQKDQYLDPPSFVKNRGIGITVSAKDPVRIIQYFDNLLKEENQVLRSWGIKGETFEVNDQGRMYRTPEQIAKIDETFNEKFGFKYYSWNWPLWGNGSSFPDGNAVSPGVQPEVFQMSLTDADKAILEKYGVKTYSEMFAAPDERPWFPAWAIPKEQGSPQQIFTTKSDEITKKYFPKLVLANPSEFEAVWAEYTGEMGKLDTEQYEKWTTEEVKKLIDLAKAK
ncbi:ABC transporter substrate-binding protein [Paenibacillus prosopidis]|uniref:Aldotetraouronic acid ABC transporter substrate-binding protein n=1 Tax=Paenibacillus prosopidis TaxID=630520 RepID=A0A368W2T7_9BACL|nr:ABC transporter substrate-binding protein [Paenibacillus prosopidis]RCW47588.1 aldotetraouronic acid ABC transporter substrate-binding protein [Paenibacillus prosopidis]